MSFWKDKVVIITGSSQGIGLEMARQAGQAGARVVINGRHPAKLDRVRTQLEQEGISLFPIVGDVSDPTDSERLIRETVGEFNRLDVLINNAGLTTDNQPFDQMPPEVFKKIIDVNLLGSVYPSQHALPYLRQSSGHLLFIGSEAGLHGLPDYSAYSASKMALRALVDSIRIELQQSSVHVGLAYVGFTQNDPYKRVITIDGDTAPIQNRSPIKPMPREKTARLLLQMIERRSHRKIFSPLGRLLNLLHKINPNLVHYALKQNYRRD